jgi:serine/threonine-protein kinase Chk1
MFESLKVSFDADPFKGSQRSVDGDAMDVDTDKSASASISSTQPITAVQDMLDDWERPSLLKASSTQPQHVMGHATQSINISNALMDEPSMSQFAIQPSVPLSRTQMARRFGDILPAQSLTKFYSIWTLSLLVPVVLEALQLLGIPTPVIGRLSGQDTSCSIKFATPDSRGCRLSGWIAVETVADGLIEVLFVKASGDPLEWRRLFKRVAVLCKDAVYRPE